MYAWTTEHTDGQNRVYWDDVTYDNDNGPAVESPVPPVHPMDEPEASLLLPDTQVELEAALDSLIGSAPFGTRSCRGRTRLPPQPRQ